MRRVLFVDDDPEMLAALRRLLYPLRQEWEMEFAEGGKAGLAAIDARQFDAAVSDMRMPDVDGAAFLTHVQERHPRTIRIVLSGIADLEATLRVVPIAHQFLTKPAKVAEIREAVDRSCNLRDTLSDQLVQQSVGEIKSLPILPTLYAELTTALTDPCTNVMRVAAIVEQDMAMSAKVLQLVNSAFFGIRRRVTSVQHAVTFLGMPMIRHIVLSLEVFSLPSGTPRLTGFSLDTERAHALTVGNLARTLIPDKKLAEDAFAAGLLHDIGKLVLATRMPKRYAEVLSSPARHRQPITQLEEQFLGVTHAEIGAYLLALWGLPDPVVEAVAFHHCPSRVKHASFDILSAVHVANYLASSPRPSAPIIELDHDYLADLGIDVATELPRWRSLARTARGGDR